MMGERLVAVRGNFFLGGARGKFSEERGTPRREAGACYFAIWRMAHRLQFGRDAVCTDAASAAGAGHLSNAVGYHCSCTTLWPESTVKT